MSNDLTSERVFGRVRRVRRHGPGRSPSNMRSLRRKPAVPAIHSDTASGTTIRRPLPCRSRAIVRAFGAELDERERGIGGNRPANSLRTEAVQAIVPQSSLKHFETNGCAVQRVHLRRRRDPTAESVGCKSRLGSASCLVAARPRHFRVGRTAGNVLASAWLSGSQEGGRIQ